MSATYKLTAALLSAATELIGTLPAEQRTARGMSVRKLLNLIEQAVESQDAVRKLAFPRLLDPHELCGDHPPR